jgi:hypothetical protein
MGWFCGDLKELISTLEGDAEGVWLLMATIDLRADLKDAMT